MLRLHQLQACSCCGLLAPSAPAPAETRLALAISNLKYTQAGARLTSTHYDGDLVKEWRRSVVGQFEF